MIDGLLLLTQVLALVALNLLLLFAIVWASVSVACWVRDELLPLLGKRDRDDG